ncbi:MAG: glycine--tRNA ligase subunit beta [Paracoccaceae bacterium]|nr:glycine--tRNA ligase subunit beta [Paracoccaceae bacterium]MDP5351886.1 glycine--tRNA ligase subunit beta [Paracoccaceae bacterium]MDP5354431.1 glycine--tRNA ligase subunit beta [Paracoccaceae bacterium]MDP5357705.1 glycine--tRNA ligase subunit beta [Paracoccaceae bacterium]MDP5369920.1 glycine--tRNA ligase subunit beta [Paracoccaceae bacterium]
MPDLLIELFSEEIPARMQKRAAQDLKKLVTDGLVEAGLTYSAAGVFSTPRRLTLSIEGLLAQSPPQKEERKGPKTDAPQAAIDGFLRATGVNIDALEPRDDKKGQVYFAVVSKPGRPAAAIVTEVLEGAIRTFPWPKSMRWGTGSLRWVRPLHRILCLLCDEGGSEIVPLSVDHITASNITEGHRFLAPTPFSVKGFDDYSQKLARAFVVLDPETRAQSIWHDATTQAFALGLEVVEDAGLLAEVAGLVEWPVVLMGEIGIDFLALPAEVLQTSMREHQKFFSVKNPKTGRIERFITVANNAPQDGGTLILKGNQKVLSARLSDAKFFWENDLRRIQANGLEGMGAGLSAVTFHNKLGSQAERIARIATLAAHLAPMMDVDPERAILAAKVAKADLQSAMVGEFPELQGTMGSYYARVQNLPPEVAQCCKDHYAPLGPQDAVPDDALALVVGLADKIDTLTSFWAIGEKPTGSKDPFALRRATLGIIRIILTKDLHLNLRGLFTHANTLANADDLLSFFHDRLKVYLRDQGIRHDIIDACLVGVGNDDLLQVTRRAQALAAGLQTDDGENLRQAFLRANNILAQAEAKDGVEYSYGADPKFAENDIERAVFTALDHAEPLIAKAIHEQDFISSMAYMAALREPLDAFFTGLQINSDNAIIRRNRLNLLHRIRSTCGQLADLSKVVG